MLLAVSKFVYGLSVHFYYMRVKITFYFSVQKISLVLPFLVSSTLSDSYFENVLSVNSNNVLTMKEVAMLMVIP